MTMTLELLKEIAAELAPDQVAVEIADVELQRWIPVCPPLQVERQLRSGSNRSCRTASSWT